MSSIECRKSYLFLINVEVNIVVLNNILKLKNGAVFPFFFFFLTRERNFKMTTILGSKYNAFNTF